MDYEGFIRSWCRWVPHTAGTERLSLKEKANLDCVFWNDGCSVYGTRPLQCRAFPFWDSIVCSQAAWERMAKECPGMDSGELHSGEEIESFLNKMDDEPVVERRIGGRRMGEG